MAEENQEEKPVDPYKAYEKLLKPKKVIKAEKPKEKKE